MYKDPMLWRYPEEIRSISTPGGTVTTLWSQSSPRSTNESETWTPYPRFLPLPRRSPLPSDHSFNDFPSIIAARKTVFLPLVLVRSRISSNDADHTLPEVDQSADQPTDDDSMCKISSGFDSGVLKQKLEEDLFRCCRHDTWWDSARGRQPLIRVSILSAVATAMPTIV